MRPKLREPAAEPPRTPSGVEYVRTPDDRFDDLPDFPYAPSYVDVDGLRVLELGCGDGRFTFRAVEPGRYTAFVETGNAVARRNVDVVAGGRAWAVAGAAAAAGAGETRGDLFRSAAVLVRAAGRRAERSEELPAERADPAPDGDVPLVGLAERLAAPDPHLQFPLREFEDGRSGRHRRRRLDVDRELRERPGGIRCRTRRRRRVGRLAAQQVGLPRPGRAEGGPARLQQRRARARRRSGPCSRAGAGRRGRRTAPLLGDGPAGSRNTARP